ncbi:ras and EF-hand domain-containing protein-like protein, partial [Dinothrombium tinctorium]
MSKDRLLALFNACDVDGSGYIGQDEVRQICEKFNISAADADTVFEDLDRDGDGQISFEDFCAGFLEFEKSTNNRSNSFENIKRALDEERRNEQQFEEHQNRRSHLREKRDHKEHLQHIEEEVDSQVREAENRVKQKAKEELEADRKYFKEMLKNEMNELQAHLSMFDKVEAWLKSSANNDHDEKLSEFQNELERERQETRQIKMAMLETQTTLAMMRNEVERLRKECKELRIERVKGQEVFQEQEELRKQLQLMQIANRHLKDTNDALRSRLDVEQFVLSTVPENDDVLKDNSSNFKRGSIIGDYIDLSRRNNVPKSNVGLSSNIRDEQLENEAYETSPVKPYSANHYVTFEDKKRNMFQHLHRAKSTECVCTRRILQKVKPQSIDDSMIKAGEKIEMIETCQTDVVITDSNGPSERAYNVIFIGDASVGKTSFISRIMKNIFRSLTKSYFRKADGIILVYDVTNETSFLNVREWMNAIEDINGRSVPVVLVGNKTDLRDEQKDFVKTSSGHRISE